MKDKGATFFFAGEGELFRRITLKGPDHKLVRKRLRASTPAIKALLDLASGSAPKAASIIEACVKAYRFKQTFIQGMQEVRVSHADLDQLAVELKHLRRFADRTVKGEHSQYTFGFERLIVNKDVVQQGLSQLEVWLEIKRSFLNWGTRDLLGATRKSRGPQAAETAAIRMLALDIRAICQRASYSEVATISTAVLATNEAVTIDRVRGAVKKRLSSPPGINIDWSGLFALKKASE